MWAGPVAALMLQRGPKQGAIAVNAVGTLVGLPCALLASVVLGERWIVPATTEELLPIAYLTVAGSLGAFVLFAWLATQWRATSIAFLGVVIPVIAVTLGTAVRHEALASGSIFGAVIVIVGVAVALRSTAQRGDLA